MILQVHEVRPVQLRLISHRIGEDLLLLQPGSIVAVYGLALLELLGEALVPSIFRHLRILCSLILFTLLATWGRQIVVWGLNVDSKRFETRNFLFQLLECLETSEEVVQCVD